jgi:hypothetical protein
MASRCIPWWSKEAGRIGDNLGVVRQANRPSIGWDFCRGERQVALIEVRQHIFTGQVDFAPTKIPVSVAKIPKYQKVGAL